MHEIIEKQKCYGCGACVEACPQKCIVMKEDEYGFFYPCINEIKCIDCGACRKKCIAINKKDERNIPVCFIGVHKDENIWLNSSSGGAFTAILQSLFIDNTVIVGAVYDENLIVRHSTADSLVDIEKFRKSKYVQSNLGTIYREIKNYLKEGRRVIFSGTPCQVAGVYATVGKEYENLYTVELICTGVTSPLLFQSFLDLLEEKYRKKVKKIDMRHKVKNENGWNIGDTQVVFEDGKVLRNVKTRWFRQLYGQKIAYRESCYTCQFAKCEREADITIGDWWGNLEGLSGVKEPFQMLLLDSVP